VTTEERDHQRQEETTSGSSSTGRQRRKATAQSEEQVAAQAPPAETEVEKPKTGRRRKKSAEPVSEKADVDSQAAETVAAKPKATRRKKKTAEPVTEQAGAEAPAADAESAKPKAGRRRKSKAEPAAEQAVAESPAVEADSTARPARRRKRATETATAEAPQPRKPVQPRPLPRLLERLRTEIAPVMIREFGYTSPMQVPGLSKIVLNIGLGEALLNPKAMENATKELGIITGQRPVTTRAKKSIAGFKIREGMPIGTSVTLRGRRMYEFMDRLLSSTLPRIRDFRGVSREAFDGRGNYSLGIREQVIFPEIDYSSIDRIRGLQVVIGTTARTDSEGLRLLELMGMPFAISRDADRVA
jgi:large subunit ribosomal protein L5